MRRCKRIRYSKQGQRKPRKLHIAEGGWLRNGGSIRKLLTRVNDAHILKLKHKKWV